MKYYPCSEISDLEDGHERKSQEKKYLDLKEKQVTSKYISDS